MSMTFTKLFSSITESTIWVEDHQTRIVWITMLAMSDAYGRVWGSIPGLANRARVSVDECVNALEKFKSPDKYSRSKEHEGKRIEEIEGGWRLLNHAKYREIRDHEAAKQSKREYIKKRRAVENVERCRTLSNAVEHGRYNAEADADTEALNTTPLPPKGGEGDENHPAQVKPKRIAAKAENEAQSEHPALAVSDPSPKKRVGRPRNPVLDAFASLDAPDITQVPPMRWKHYQKIRKDIEAICPDLTAQEVFRRADNYRKHFSVKISAAALHNHWAKCDVSGSATAYEPIRVGL
jgi:hypothetical protein